MENWTLGFLKFDFLFHFQKSNRNIEKFIKNILTWLSIYICYTAYNLRILDGPVRQETVLLDSKNREGKSTVSFICTTVWALVSSCVK